MYLKVTATGIEVLELDVFRDLYVSIIGVDDAAAALSLSRSGFGDLVGDHCWIVAERLRAMREGDDKWLVGFSAMQKFALDHGWTNEGGTKIRAHVVRSNDWSTK